MKKRRILVLLRIKMRVGTWRALWSEEEVGCPLATSLTWSMPSSLPFSFNYAPWLSSLSFPSLSISSASLSAPSSWPSSGISKPRLHQCYHHHVCPHCHHPLIKHHDCLYQHQHNYQHYHHYHCSYLRIDWGLNWSLHGGHWAWKGSQCRAAPSLLRSEKIID